MVRVTVAVRIPAELRQLGTIADMKFRQYFSSGANMARATVTFTSRTGETMASLRSKIERAPGSLIGTLSVGTVAGVVQEYGQPGGPTQYTLTKSAKRTAYIADRPAQLPRLFMRRSIRRAMTAFRKDVQRVIAAAAAR